MLQLVFIQLIILIQPLLDWLTGVEFSLNRRFQGWNVPLLWYALWRNIFINQPRDNFFPHFLKQVRDVITGHEFVSLAIDNSSLIVSDIVVFKQLFSDIKISPFDLSLSFLNRAGHHAMLDSLSVLHTQFPHEILYPFAGEDPE